MLFYLGLKVKVFVLVQTEISHLLNRLPWHLGPDMVAAATGWLKLIAHMSNIQGPLHFIPLSLLFKIPSKIFLNEGFTDSCEALLLFLASSCFKPLDVRMPQANCGSPLHHSPCAGKHFTRGQIRRCMIYCFCV